MTINFLNIAQVLVAMALIGFILIQRGPGATAGSAFGGGGGGASGTVFGAKGSGSFLTKATAILATLFFIITMLIAIDARDAYSSAGETTEQDLGVFGTLDEAQTPSMTPVDDEASAGDINDVINAVEDASKDAVETVNDNLDSAADAVEDAAEKIESEVDEATDSDDGNNN